MIAILLAISLKLVCPFPQIILEDSNITPSLQAKIERASGYCRKVFKDKKCVEYIKVRSDKKIEISCTHERIIEKR